MALEEFILNLFNTYLLAEVFIKATNHSSISYILITVSPEDNKVLISDSCVVPFSSVIAAVKEPSSNTTSLLIASK